VPASEYHCDFHDADAPGWIIYGGSWHVQDGRWWAPMAAGTAGVKAVASGTDFADFTYDAEVTPAASGDAGLIFRVTRPSIGDNAFDGYYVGVYPQDGIIRLGKCSAVDNSWTPLADARLAVQPGTPIHLRVTAAGPKLEIFVDGAANAILTVNDDSFSHGAIGVRRYATSETTAAGFGHLAVVSLPSR
jgi:hypothetical protein